MSRNRHAARITLPAALAATGLLCACSPEPAAPGAAPPPRVVSEAQRRASERMRPRLPNIALQTHEGRRVRFYDDLVRGRVVLINFIYTKCTGI